MRAPCAAAALVAALALASCGGAHAPPAASSGARSAILITLDTTRPDALSCYGGPPGWTPVLDRLAAEGVRYTNARSPVPLTLPAHASMLTGLVPLRHGLRDNGLAQLPPAAYTLAELAREHGLATAAFVGSVVLDHAFGLAQGFDVYDGPRAPEQQSTRHYAERPAAEVAAAAVDWLRARNRSRPFLLWVHFYDPHAPYQAQEGASAAPAGPPGWQNYLSEVAAVDRAIGRILAELDAQGAREATSVLALADHGEGFGEHGEESHGVYCYDSTLRIPMILCRADRARAGSRDDSICSAIDVLPTLADALGLPIPGGLDGLSLWSAPAPAERGIYVESNFGWLSYGWSQIAGWCDARAKYLHSAGPELYELGSDPHEQRNAFAAAAPQVAAARASMRELMARPRLDARSAESGGLHADLSALGYAGAGAAPERWPEPLDDLARTAPLAGREELQLFFEAAKLANARKPAEALPALARVLALNPHNYKALDHQSLQLIQIGRFADALPVLEKLAAEGPHWPTTGFNLALCLDKLGRREEALERNGAALALDPRSAAGWSQRLGLARALGRADEVALCERKLAELGAHAR